MASDSLDHAFEAAALLARKDKDFADRMAKAICIIRQDIEMLSSVRRPDVLPLDSSEDAAMKILRRRAASIMGAASDVSPEKAMLAAIESIISTGPRFRSEEAARVAARLYLIAHPKKDNGHPHP